MLWMALQVTVIIGTKMETANYFNGSLADTYYVDGSLIAYTTFGETDSTSGQWETKNVTNSSSFGNAGFFLNLKIFKFRFRYKR